jgi:hypothetical protein
MFKKPTLLAITSLILVGIFSLSYFYFSKYQPKALKIVTEVKGLSNINTDDFPYPSDAIKVGTSKTLNTTQTTFTTQKNIQDTVEFYKNIYSQKNWKTVSEKITNGTSTISFQKDGETINIVLTEENEGETVVSIESVKE